MLTVIVATIFWIIAAAVLLFMLSLAFGRHHIPPEPPNVPDENKQRGFEVLPPK